VTFSPLTSLTLSYLVPVVVLVDRDPAALDRPRANVDHPVVCQAEDQFVEGVFFFVLFVAPVDQRNHYGTDAAGCGGSEYEA